MTKEGRKQEGQRLQSLLSGILGFCYDSLIIVKLTELTFIEHLLCAKHHARYFTFHPHKVLRDGDYFTIGETGLERRGDLPRASQPGLNSQLVLLHHSARPSCLLLSICFPRPSAVRVHLGKKGIGLSHLGFHSSVHRQKRSTVLRTKMDHFLFWLSLAGKFRIMKGGCYRTRRII